jgi:uncharacterized protein (TIGR02453 family)
MSFAGFPVAALDFYDDLEVDNTKSFWTAHKHIYEEAVRGPMLALTAELEDEFGEAKVFRPYRDLRYSAQPGRDKSPYKDHQGAFVAAGPAVGWYVEIGSPGVRIGAGFYHPSSEQLAAIRAGIDDERRGTSLESMVERIRRRRDWTVGGDQVRSAPRGWPADHPRIELLRHRSLIVGRSYGFGERIQTRRLLTDVRRDWRTARPIVDWVLDAIEGVA